jgi:hypothetical protein
MNISLLILFVTLVVFLWIHGYYSHSQILSEGFATVKCDCNDLQNQNDDWKKRANNYSKNLNQCIASQLDMNNFMNEYIQKSESSLNTKYTAIESEYKSQIDILTKKYNELASKINLKVEQNKNMADQIANKDNLVTEEEGQENSNVVTEEESASMSNVKKLDANNKNIFGFSDTV